MVGKWKLDQFTEKCYYVTVQTNIRCLINMKTPITSLEPCNIVNSYLP